MSELITFAERITGENLNRIEEDLGQGYVKLNSTEAEKRQAKHDIQWVEDIVIELLRNSRDAKAKNVLLATKKDVNENRQIIVIDDGCGVPADLSSAVFQPRVTSKLNSLVIDNYGVHGRGMALFSISKNSSLARIHRSEVGLGTVLVVEVNINKLPERKDQSTFPKITTKGGRKRIVKGPNNIIRKVAELSIENPNINFYTGSPSQIIATVCSLDRLSSSDSALWSGIGRITSVDKFISLVHEKFGITLSERNAYRIIVGDIVPMQPILSPVTKEGLSLVHLPERSKRNKIKIPTMALKEISKVIENAFNKEAGKYFLKTYGPVKVHFNDNTIKISINVSRDERDS